MRAEILCKEMDSIERGIVQLIYEYEIKWLVMGAAANKFYSRYTANMRLSGLFIVVLLNLLSFSSLHYHLQDDGSLLCTFHLLHNYSTFRFSSFVELCLYVVA